MQYNEFTINEIELHSQSDDSLHELCDFWDIAFRWYEKDDPLPDREQRIRNIRNPWPHSSSFNWVIRHKTKIIGHADMSFNKESSPNYEQNKHTFDGSVSILPEYRRQGIASFMTKQILKRALEQGKTLLQSGASLESAFAFMEDFLGGKLAQQGAENRLRIDEVNWEMMQQWIDDGKTRNPDTQLVFYEDCPEELIEAYMVIYTEVMNQMPKGEMEWEYKGTPETRRESEQRIKDLGIRWFTLITQEPDGRISGLTEMFYNPKREYRIAQELTGVRDRDRGRGLGKWLKAEMLRRMVTRYPTINYVSTGNADSNAPMLAINERMGFKKNRVWQVYKFDAMELLDRLETIST